MPRVFLRGLSQETAPSRGIGPNVTLATFVGVNGVSPLRVEITTLRISLSLASLTEAANRETLPLRC